MNSPFHYARPSKLRSAARTIFRNGPLVILAGSILYIVLHEPYYQESFSWPVMRHWLCLVSVAAVVLTGLLFAVTLGIFAFNSDWHTFDGCVGLLHWLVIEAVMIGVLAGLGWLVATVLDLR